MGAEEIILSKKSVEVTFSMATKGPKMSTATTIVVKLADTIAKRMEEMFPSVTSPKKKRTHQGSAVCPEFSFSSCEDRDSRQSGCPASMSSRGLGLEEEFNIESCVRYK